MVMKWLESELRRTGNSQDQMLADQLSFNRKARGRDFPLPMSTESVNSGEEYKGKQFSPETRDLLERDGFVIFGLRGLSVERLNDRVVGSYGMLGEEAEEPSLRTQVAINPQQLLLVNSNSKTRSQQERLVKAYSSEVTARYQHAVAVMGKAADHVDLGDLLITNGLDYPVFGKMSIRTSSFHYIYRDHTVTIRANFQDRQKLQLDMRDHNTASHSWVLPLIVPR